jgi:hypothetical protein
MQMARSVTVQIPLTSIRYFSAFRFQTKILPLPVPSLFFPIVFRKFFSSVPPMELVEKTEQKMNNDGVRVVV